MKQPAKLTTQSPGATIVAAYRASLASEVGWKKGAEPRLRAIARIIGREDGDYMAVNWSTLNAANVRAVLNRLHRQGKAPNTIKLTRSVLRGVARAARELRLIDADVLMDIERVKAPSGSRKQAGRDLNEESKTALMRAALSQKSPVAERDAAMIALFMATGARIHEICIANIEDIDLRNATWRVLGKGNKERVVPLNAQALSFLKNWFAVRGRAEGALFCAINKAGKMRVDGNMSTVSAHKAIKRIARIAGVEVSAHDFRRTVVGDLLEAGVDVSTGMSITGHSKVETFVSYDRRAASRQREAVEKINVPS